MRPPVFFPLDLEHEYVVHVIVRVESPGRLRCDVGVDLSRMPEILDQAAGKGLYRGPGAGSPCSTIVAPSANSRSTIAGSTWSATWAPNPPEAV